MHESSVAPNSLLKLAVAAYDAASLAKEQSDWYAAMFAAIKQQSKPFTDAHKLASAGLHLAGDLANSLDCNCADLDEHIKRLTAPRTRMNTLTLSEQIALLNKIAEDAHEAPGDALRRLWTELPEEQADPSIRFLWHAVRLKCEYLVGRKGR